MTWHSHINPTWRQKGCKLTQSPAKNKVVKLSGLRKQGHFQNYREPAALCFDSDQLVQREGLLPSKIVRYASLEGPQVNKILSFLN